jgi:S-adenosylmethionine:tRNA-ribosyltransferase-isomerase (queuine synthetase)
MLVSEFDYILPEELIAQTPAEKRDNSRMMVLGVNDKTISHKHFYDIVDLLDKTRKKVLRSYVTESDGTLLFPYLKAGKYCIRITEDINRNNIVDTGNLLEHRQPEKVMFFKIKDQFLIDIPERTEYVQKIDMEELFR